MTISKNKRTFQTRQKQRNVPARMEFGEGPVTMMISTNCHKGVVLVQMEKRVTPEQDFFNSSEW